jgi:phosphatidylserine decarboxylase
MASKTSEENERTTIVVRKQYIRCYSIQTNCWCLARRIVNYTEEGMQIVQGTDAGFIKFGSKSICFTY